MGFPGGTGDKEPACQCRYLDLYCVNCFVYFLIHYIKSYLKVGTCLRNHFAHGNCLEFVELNKAFEGKQKTILDNGVND